MPKTRIPSPGPSNPDDFMDLCSANHEHPKCDFDLSHVSSRKEALKQLDAAPTQITRLRLWFNNLDDFSFLSRFPRLETLSIAGWGAATLDALKLVPRLKWLNILHLPKVTDLAPLRHLQKLEYLVLMTLPSWDPSGKKNLFHTFRPLASLPRLSHLAIIKANVERDSLRPLAAIASLRTLDLDGDFDLRDVAWLAAKRPDIRCKLLVPFWSPQPIPCKKCGTPIVRLSGRRGPRKPLWVCPQCRKKYFEAAVAEFNALVEEARNK